MDDLHDLLKQTTDVNVRDEILRIIQTFAHAFRNEPSYIAVQDKMKVLKVKGFQFPVLKESDAMFSANSAPVWADGECCHRCRVQFTMVVRKHHCRHCGQVFCAKCSSKTSTIPKFGIEKEVRVCDICFVKINKKIDKKPSQVKNSEELKAKNPSIPSSTPHKKTEQEIQEEEELQLALALSKSEAESKERERIRYSQYNSASKMNASNSNTKHKKSLKSKVSKSAKKSSNKIEVFNENEDPELSRYLNREYWEQRSNVYADYEPSPSPSAPQPSLTTTAKVSNVEIVEPKVFKEILPDTTNNNDEIDTFTNSLRSTIEIFVNRLNSNKLRGRPITNDNGVQSLFMNLTNLHSQLIMYTQQTNESRTNCERLQDKISQIRDARAALDSLREEHREQMRRAAEEAERIRQQQMAQKLEIMRKKKQEYLQYQRELALQRMHEQELMIRNDKFKFANLNASQLVNAPQWNNPAYYVPNQSFSTSMIGQQIPHIGGQYSNNSNINTNTSQQTMAATVPMAIPVQTQSLPQVMPQYGQGSITSLPAPNIFIPHVVSNYPQDIQQSTPQVQQPTATYSMIAPVANQQIPQTPAPEAPKEELLIKFD